MPRNRRTRIAEDVWNAVYSLLTGAGALLGLLWALDRPTPSTPKACAKATADSIGDCAAQSLWAALTPYLVGVGTGVLAGALLTLAAKALLSRRQRPTTELEPRWIVARFPGQCVLCHGAVAPGDRVRHVPGRVLCQACGG
jgi:hypothetical protein